MTQGRSWPGSPRTSSLPSASDSGEHTHAGRATVVGVDEAAAVELGIRNQVSQLRHLAEHSTGGRTEGDERYLLFAGGHDYPGTHTNGAIRASETVSAAEFLARADAFFGALGRRYYLWTERSRDADLDAVARRRGAFLRPPESGIPCILRTSPLAPVPEPPGWTITEARSDAERREYLSIVARNYDLAGVADELAESVLFSIASLRTPNVLVLLARSVDGSVGSGISTFAADGCIGVQWVVTDPAARGNGLGSALIQRGTAWGFANGARCAWGTASQQGLPVWTKLGFTIPAAYHRWLVTPHATQVPPARDMSSGPSPLRGVRRRPREIDDAGQAR